MDQLRADLQRVRKGDGINPARLAQCTVLPDLQCVRQRLAPEEREDRGLRVTEACKWLRTEILLLRDDAKGEVLQREFAVGLERNPKTLGERRRDLASDRSAAAPLETVRTHGDQMLSLLHSHLVDLERESRKQPERMAESLLPATAPFEYLTIDGIYRFTDSRVPIELHDSRVVRSHVDQLDTLYGRHLYTGGSDGVHFEILDGAEADSEYEPRVSATGLLVHRLKLVPPLAKNRVRRIVTRTVVDDRSTVPQPFVSTTAEVFTGAIRITTEFPKGDAPRFVERFVSWAYEVPIPLDFVPLVEVPVEGGRAEVRFDKVEPGVSVGMRWKWPSS